MKLKFWDSAKTTFSDFCQMSCRAVFVKFQQGGVGLLPSLPFLSRPFPSLLSFPSLPSLRRRPLKSSYGGLGERQPKSNLVLFSHKIWHLVPTIGMIFLRINWPNFVHFKQQRQLGYSSNHSNFVFVTCWSQCTHHYIQICTPGLRAAAKPANRKSQTFQQEKQKSVCRSSQVSQPTIYS